MLSLCCVALASSAHVAEIKLSKTELVLGNGLVERRLRLKDFVVSTSMRRLDTGREFLRSVEPEAVLTIDGQEIWVGGSTPPPNRAFLDPAWLEDLKPNPKSMRYVGVELTEVARPIPYRPVAGRPYPPHGKAALLRFEGNGLKVGLRLEIYDGLPIIGKQLTVENVSAKSIRLDNITSERLAVVESESNVEAHGVAQRQHLTALSDMAFGGSALESGSAVHWTTDPEYTTQVSYSLQTPCLLDVHPPVGPAADIAPGGKFSSIRSYVVLHGTDTWELRSMELRQAMRHLAPWVLDNPLMLHIVSTDDAVVKRALDQAAECGFEMAILSFGSGLNMEDTSPANIAKFRALREYADSKGIRLGGYSLLASRRIDDANDVINVKTGKPGGAIFGNSPCLGSTWGQNYFKNIKTFIAETGFRMLEHDGNYPGDPCASTTHPGHRGYEDSQWNQWQTITEFYRWCREHDVFLNVPDMYYLAGSNKNGMGYRETNWSLPREQQHVHSRQNLFDGTFEKTPSMGWMFVPLVEYQGGGAAATIEPLKDHLLDYELHFANTLGFGAQACWRGTRLYDSPETKSVVVRMVSWFKQYREILESDVVHLRRADGRRIDFILHVNPAGKPRAMLMAYNPTSTKLSETISVPLALAGIQGTAKLREREGKVRSVRLQGSELSLPLKIAAKGWTYFVIE